MKKSIGGGSGSRTRAGATNYLIDGARLTSQLIDNSLPCGQLVVLWSPLQSSGVLPSLGDILETAWCCYGPPDWPRRNGFLPSSKEPLSPGPHRGPHRLRLEGATDSYPSREPFLIGEELPGGMRPQRVAGDLWGAPGDWSAPKRAGGAEKVPGRDAEADCNGENDGIPPSRLPRRLPRSQHQRSRCPL